jgi:ribosomal protein S27AE
LGVDVTNVRRNTMNDGWREKYTKCAVCGRVTHCCTFVSNGSYDYVDDNGNPEWFCPNCVDAYVFPEEEEHGDVGRVWCGNCGELVYPDEDDETCPECGCNVYM